MKLFELTFIGIAILLIALWALEMQSRITALEMQLLELAKAVLS